MNVPGAREVKRVVTIPVITVSGIEPVLGEEILQKGEVDFIGMCRPAPTAGAGRLRRQQLETTTSRRQLAHQLTMYARRGRSVNSQIVPP